MNVVESESESRFRLAEFKSNLSIGNRIARLVWGWAWMLLFRPSPRVAFAWRRLLLRVFGARLGKNVRIYASAEVFLPANLTLGDNVVVGPKVDLYCVDDIFVEENAILSQRCELCTGTHDYSKPDMPLVTKSIKVCRGAWVCAGAFIGPGVTVERDSVVGARAVVFKDVEHGTIVAGNPAKFVKAKDRTS